MHLATYSLKVTEVLNVELNSQVYVPPSVVRKGENWRMVSVEPLTTNTLDEVSVLVMASDRALLPDSWCGVAGEGQ